MIIGIPKETKPNEYRVAATPDAVKQLVSEGHTVLVSQDAGLGSTFTDADYSEAGAKVVPQAEVFRDAEFLYKVKEYQEDELDTLREGQIVFTYLHSNAYPEQTKAMLEAKIIGIAYEDVTDAQGGFPLLAPMSELAGRGGFLAATHYMQSVHGGPGVMLADLDSANSPVVVIIGAGTSGRAAAKMAAALGNEVILFDNNPEIVDSLSAQFPENVSVQLISNERLDIALRRADVLLNCVLWPKWRKDHLIDRAMLQSFKRGALIVDVACDEGGAVETCRSTSHDDPIYSVDGVRHYCVDNIPSGFSKAASELLSQATLPHVLRIGEIGVERALSEDPYLRRGLSFYKGTLTLEETGRKQNLPFVSPEEVLHLN